MKKFAGVLLALVLCLALSVGVFAVETPVDDKLIADIVNGIGDLVEAESEGDDEKMKKTVEKLYSDLQVAQQSSNISAVIDNAVKNALEEDNDTSAILQIAELLILLSANFLLMAVMTPLKS